MRYYFRDNQSAPWRRLLFGGGILAVVAFIVGGFDFSRGLPISANPFAAQDGPSKKSGDDENLERIFIPVRKKFPPDPFPVDLEDGQDTPVAESVKQQTGSSDVRPGEAVVSSVAEGKKSAPAASSDRNDAGAVPEFASVPEGAMRDAASVKSAPPATAKSVPGSSGVATRKAVRAGVPAKAPDRRSGPAGVALTKPSRLAPVAKPEKKRKHADRSSPVGTGGRPVADAKPKYRKLETVVEISDSGETVDGTRWKDVTGLLE